MREIKFRVWNPTTNRMIKIADKSNDTALWIDENGFYVMDHFKGKPEEIGSMIDGLVLMQYTGLKDKNGVEIYEGDIVKTSRRIGRGFNPNEIEAVRYSEILAQYKPSEIVIKEQCEVIGNIYENSNLLEAK